MSKGVHTQTIDSHDLNVSTIMQDFYTVPTYQREYVWTERQVEQLLQDILSEFPDAGQPLAEYFVGSIVVCPGTDGMLDLIDGQQRMTTFFLITCAVRDRLVALGETPPQIISSQINSESMDDMGRAIKRFRIRLQYSDSAGILEQIGTHINLDVSALPNTRSAQRIIEAYKTIRHFLAQEFKEDPLEVQRFYAYIINHVKLVRIKTQSVTHALKVFETVNDRGVSLNSMDLLKNLMFIHASQDDYDQLKNVWKSLVDELHRVHEKPLRFLRYYIFAEYGVDRLREEEVYRWIVDNEQSVDFRSDPVGFACRLRDAATAFAHFSEGKSPDGSPNRYLSNTAALSYAARQHFILLLAGKNLSTEVFMGLCRHIENLLLAYVITREPTNVLERSFAQWAPALAKCRNGSDLKGFVDLHFDPAMRRLSERFDLAFQQLSEDTVPRYRLRYILGKLTQYVDERAYGKTEYNLNTFLDEKDLEHILPQTPSPESTFDRPDEYASYVSRLGNLTILEDSLNRSIRNKPFAAKKTVYSKSRFLITRTIAAPLTVGATKLDHAIDGLLTFDNWDSAAIESRQRMLAHLARRVWDVPDA